MAAAVIASRPEDASTRDAKRRERPRHGDEVRSPDAKRCRRDGAHYRVSSSSSGAAGRKRKRVDSVRGSRGGDRRRRYSSSSRVSCIRRSHYARRTPKSRDDERAQGCKRRRSRSPPSEPKTRPQVPCAPAPQAQQPQTLPAAAPSCPRVAAAALANSQPPPQDLTEQFEETELRRRETQRKREEARREMDKVVQSVYFDDPFVSLVDILKRCSMNAGTYGWPA